MEKFIVRLRVTSRTAIFYIAGSIFILPWTIYLGQTLPTRHVFLHWDVAWVGLDILLICSLLLTGILTYRKSLWVILSAMATGSFLLVDAWFDITGEHLGRLFNEALLAAIFIEIPLAFVSYRLAYKTL